MNLATLRMWGGGRREGGGGREGGREGGGGRGGREGGREGGNMGLWWLRTNPVHAVPTAAATQVALTELVGCQVGEEIKKTSP